MLDSNDYDGAMKVLLEEIKNGGHGDSICPESLTSIREAADCHGWPSPTIRQAYNITMRGFRAMFAPADKSREDLLSSFNVTMRQFEHDAGNLKVMGELYKVGSVEKKQFSVVARAVKESFEDVLEVFERL